MIKDVTYVLIIRVNGWGYLSDVRVKSSVQLIAEQLNLGLREVLGGPTFLVWVTKEKNYFT